MNDVTESINENLLGPQGDEDQILKRLTEVKKVNFTCDCPEWDENDNPLPPCNCN
jgi:hypothetical protein